MVSHLNDRLASLPVDLQEANGLECFLAVCLCYCLIVDLHQMLRSEALGHI